MDQDASATLEDHDGDNTEDVDSMGQYEVQSRENGIGGERQAQTKLFLRTMEPHQRVLPMKTSKLEMKMICRTVRMTVWYFQPM